MSSLKFQNHNKENVEGYFNSSRIKGSGQVHGTNFTLQNRGLKSMHSINGAAIVTPRKTLGDIQNSQTPHTGLKLNANQTLKPVLMKPTLNLQKSSVKKKKSISNRFTSMKEKGKKAVLSPVSFKIDKKERNIYCEEIETMHNEEGKEERCPPEEKVSIYLNKIISWRPHCLFGIPPVSEGESDDERSSEEMRNTMVNNLDALADLDPYNLDFEDEPNLEPVEVQIPYIDETLQELDDSYGCGLSPNLGILQLNDTVFN